MSTSHCSTEPRARHGRTGDAFAVRPSFMCRFCLGPAVSSCVAGRDRTRPPAGDLRAGVSSVWTLENILSVAEVGRVGVCQGSSQEKGRPSEIFPQLLQKSTDLAPLGSSDNRADAVGSPGGWRAGRRRNPSCWGVGLCRMSLPISSAGGRSSGETFAVQYHLPNAASTSSEAASNGGFFCFCELFLGLAALLSWSAHRPNGTWGRGGWKTPMTPRGPRVGVPKLVTTWASGATMTVATGEWQIG